MKALIKSVNFGISMLLILSAIAIAYIAIPAFGNKALIVRSGSMQPAIGVGDLVVVKTQKGLLSPQSITINKYKVGDAIAFKSGQDSKLFTTHRIVGKEIQDGKVFYQTKGDANDSADQNLVAEENVVGKSIFRLPYFGKLFAFAKSNIGFPILVIFPALLVIILEMVNIFKEIKRQNRLVQVPAPKENFAGLKVIIPVFMSVMVMNNAFAYFSDTETSTGNIFQAAASFCSPGTVFQIGDVEDSQMDIPTNEFNWLGITFPLPEFTNPFIVGTTPTIEFPANSNKAYDYATDFDVEFQMPYSAQVRLTISWSPGRSANERKEVLLDDVSIGFTPDRLGTPVTGWWEQMQRFEDSFETPISAGAHTFTFLHPIGDGTLWDWVRLEITECPTPSPTPNLSASPESSPTPTPTPSASPSVGGVIINEFVANGSPEWVEFYNPNPDAEFIKSYWIDDDTDFDSDSGNSTKAPLSALNTASATFPYIELSTFLNDGGDNVVLFDNSGNILDQYTYSSSSAGVSIGRQPDRTGAFQTCGAPTKGSTNNSFCSP